MWLLEKIFGKKIEEAPKKETIGFDEVLTKIEELKKNEIDKISTEASSIVENIKTDKNLLIETINDIKTSEIVSRDARTDPILKSAKEKLTSVLTAETISIPENITLSSLKEMNLSIAEFLKTVEANRKNFYYLSVAFPEKMGSVKERLVSLEKNAKTIKELIKSGIFKAVAMVSDNMDSIHELEKKNVEMKTEINNIENKIISVKEISEKSKKELEDLKSSKEYFEYINSEKEAEEMKKELERTKTLIFTLLSPLYRPLKKFEKISDDSKNSEFIETFLENPLITLEKYDKLKIILVELLDFVERDKIIVKGKEKFVKNTNDFIKTDVVSENILKYQDLLLKIREEKKDFPVLEKIDELERHVSSENNIPNLENSISEMEKASNDNEKTISYSKTKIKEILLRNAEIELI